MESGSESESGGLGLTSGRVVDGVGEGEDVIIGFGGGDGTEDEFDGTGSVVMIGDVARLDGYFIPVIFRVGEPVESMPDVVSPSLDGGDDGRESSASGVCKVEGDAPTNGPSFT